MDSKILWAAAAIYREIFNATAHGLAPAYAKQGGVPHSVVVGTVHSCRRSSLARLCRETGYPDAIVIAALGRLYLSGHLSDVCYKGFHPFPPLPKAAPWKEGELFA